MKLVRPAPARPPPWPIAQNLQQVFLRRAGRREVAEPRFLEGQQAQAARLVGVLLHCRAQLLHQLGAARVRLLHELRRHLGLGLGLAGARGALLLDDRDPGVDWQVGIARRADPRVKRDRAGQNEAHEHHDGHLLGPRRMRLRPLALQGAVGLRIRRLISVRVCAASASVSTPRATSLSTSRSWSR